MALLAESKFYFLFSNQLSPYLNHKSKELDCYVGTVKTFCEIQFANVLMVMNLDVVAISTSMTVTVKGVT